MIYETAGFLFCLYSFLTTECLSDTTLRHLCVFVLECQGLEPAEPRQSSLETTTTTYNFVWRKEIIYLFKMALMPSIRIQVIPSTILVKLNKFMWIYFYASRYFLCDFCYCWPYDNMALWFCSDTSWLRLIKDSALIWSLILKILKETKCLLSFIV